MSFADGQNIWPPVAEIDFTVCVWAGIGLLAPKLVTDITACLAAALKVVQVAYGAVAPLPPAAIHEPVDEDTSCDPPGLASYAGWVLAEQVVAGALVDGWPVEHIWTA